MGAIVWSEQARDDLKSIYEYIYKDSPKYAEITIDNIIEATEKIELFPLSGRIVPEIKDIHIREIFYRNYRIIYNVNKDKIEILTIFYSSRNLSNTLN